MFDWVLFFIQNNFAGFFLGKVKLHVHGTYICFRPKFQQVIKIMQVLFINGS